MSNKINQKSLILEYYKNNQNRDIPHAEVVDWVVAEYRKRTGKVFRDPDRAIRSLFQEGYLEKVKTGVYRYTSDRGQLMISFTPSQKSEIMKRGKYRCAICGTREVDYGVTLHIDHTRPISRGGKSTLENGQVLCSIHNYKKKNYKQTETGKRFFKNLLRLARYKDDKLALFCQDILRTYDKHGINGHITWDEE